MLKRCAPPVVATRNKFMTFVVCECQKHAYAVPFSNSFLIAFLDFFPADPLHFFRIVFGGISADFPL